MSRMLPIIILMSVFAPWAGANQILENTLWKDYTVRKGEWVYQLARDSEVVKNGVLKTEDVVRAILKKNPEIKDPNQIQPGEKILLPIFALPEVAQPSGKTVHYHFYFNPNIYQGGMIETDSPRRPAAIPSEPSAPKKAEPTQQPNQASTSADIRPSTPFEMNLSTEANLFYKFLDSTRTSNNSNATQASNISTDIQVSADHSLIEQLRAVYVAGLSIETYPAASATLFGFKAGATWNIIGDLHFETLLGYVQSPFLYTANSAVTLDSIFHPNIDSELSYVLRTSFANITPFVSLAFAFGGSSDTIEHSSSLGYRFGARISRKLFGQDLNLSGWWNAVSSTTNVTTQNATSLGMGVGWTGRF